MNEVKWPGPGVQADLLVLELALGVKIDIQVDPSSPIAMLPAGVLRNNRIMCPPYTTNHAVAVSNLVDPLEDEGWRLDLTNRNGTYIARFQRGSEHGEGSSRFYAAEAISKAAINLRGVKLV